MSLEIAKNVLKIESDAIMEVCNSLDENFIKTVDLLYNCKGKVVITGMGKSGIICRKIAATMSSTGTPAFFIHPSEAIHGDLGVISEGDVVIAVSYSGETEEILNLAEVLKRIGIPFISLTGNPSSTLAQISNIHLSVKISKEACPLNLAPTASTTATLALGDALSMALLIRKGFKEEDFALRHPGGSLGKKLMKIKDLMHTGDSIPKVFENTNMKDVIYEMSKKGFGITAVVDREEKLKGVISDGDLRRLLQKDSDLLSKNAYLCMKTSPITISEEALGSEALKIFEERKITSLFIVDDENKLKGIIHLHDLWRVKLF